MVLALFAKRSPSLHLFLGLKTRYNRIADSHTNAQDCVYDEGHQKMLVQVHSGDKSIRELSNKRHGNRAGNCFNCIATSEQKLTGIGQLALNASSVMFLGNNPN